MLAFKFFTRYGGDGSVLGGWLVLVVGGDCQGVSGGEGGATSNRQYVIGSSGDMNASGM